MTAPQTGPALRAERIRRGMSQRACADDIGVTPHTWLRWEHDRYTPKGAAARALAAWWARSTYTQNVPASATTGEVVTVEPDDEPDEVEIIA